MTHLTITGTDGSKCHTATKSHENSYAAWRDVANAITRKFGHSRWTVVCGDVMRGDAKPLRAYGWRPDRW